MARQYEKAQGVCCDAEKGTKEKLVELAYKNAQMVLLQDTEKIKQEEQRTVGAMQEIADWLSLPHLVRVEAYDISNTSGIESVGSMVVFENGRPKKMITENLR